MNLQTSAAVKGWSIGLVTAIVDGESQSSKEVTNHIHQQIVQKDLLPGYPPPGSKNGSGKGNGAVIGPLDIAIQHTPAVIPG